MKTHTTVAALLHFISFYLTKFLGFLQKSQEENENVIKKEGNLSSEFVQNLLKEQNYLKSRVKHLTSLEKSYNDELKNLKSLLQHVKEEHPTDSYESLKGIQTIAENSINSLKDNVFSIDSM